MPENTLKRLVGAMLSGFGTFWVSEGAVAALIVGWIAVACLVLRRMPVGI